MTTTYTTKFAGDSYSVTADWGQAASQVHGVGGGRQVADFGGPDAAMRTALEESVIASGDAVDDFADEIDAAVAAMV